MGFGFISCCLGGATGERVHFGRKTLCVDYGLRRVGVAASVGFAPRPLGRIHNDGNLERVANEIAERARSELAVQLVVGMPLNGKGQEGDQAKATRKFCRFLRHSLPEPAIYLWDERFSTQTARDRLSGMSREVQQSLIDSEAAVAILEDFFQQDGLNAEVLQAGTGTIDYGAPTKVKNPAIPQVTYASWRKEMMDRASSYRAKTETGDPNFRGKSRKSKKKRKRK